MLNNSIINNVRLRQARILTGRTAKEVAELIGISAQALSQYELGKTTPTEDNFRKLLKLYGLPINFYFKPKNSENIEPTIYFRKFSSATKMKRDIAYQQSEIFITDIVGVITKKVNLPKVDPLFDNIKQSLNIEKREFNYEFMAKLIRKSWNLGYEPFDDLMYELEKRGILIIKLDLSDDIDGFSYWINNRPVMVLNKNNNFFRLRMSMAHELCHLFFHGAIEDVSKDLKRIEDEAKNFAGAFLLPDVTAAKYLNTINLQQMSYLKLKLKISVAGLLKRYEQLDYISEERALSLNKQISSKRWRKVEPYDDYYVPEEPVLIKQAINLLVDKKVYSKKQLIDLFALDEEFIVQTCNLGPKFFKEDKILNFKLL